MNITNHLIITAIILFCGLTLNLLAKKLMNKLEPQSSLTSKRFKFIWIKNLILTITFFAVFGLWASEISGALLSIAAIGAGILIVSKEFLMCFLGVFYLAITRSFNIGDHVEISTSSGEVIEISPLSFTLLVSDDQGRFTGKTVQIPLSSLLTNSVKKYSTGKYGTFITKIAVDNKDHILKQAEILKKVAFNVCTPWLEAANKELERVEKRTYIDLPTADPKVWFELSDGKSSFLVLRFTCDIRRKVSIEQEILLYFLTEKQQKEPRNAL